MADFIVILMFVMVCLFSFYLGSTYTIHKIVTETGYDEPNKWTVWKNTESNKTCLKIEQDELQNEHWYPFLVAYRNITREHKCKDWGDKCQVMYDFARYNFNKNEWTLKTYNNPSNININIKVLAYKTGPCFSPSDTD